MIDRRSLLVAGGVLVSSPSFAARSSTAFPKDFLWGAATAGHQVKGNNIASDLWLLEHTEPTVFAVPSGDAVNSLELWPRDLDIARGLGLNTYRFSLEWARIEPERGQYSIAMLDHYKRMIEGCRSRGLNPVVTFSHFTAPRWFSAAGGWTNPQAPLLFAAFCSRAARHLATGISHAVTLNEPNILRLLRVIGLPRPVLDLQRRMLAAAAQSTGSRKFVAANAANWEDLDAMTGIMVAAHHAGRDAIKSVRPDLPVGVSLALFDDEAAPGGEARRDQIRAELYGAWLDAAKGDDFIGVQNYERALWGPEGRLKPPPGAVLNWSGSEVYAPSLANAVRYVHHATGLPILVTEHGVGTDDDAIRARLIPAALAGLKKAIDDGIPVLGYIHWSLLDNYEWVFGYKPKFGLVAVDRRTFERTPKPSASVLGAIARRNAL